MKNLFRDKTVLVTGGVGSIGSQIVSTLLKKNKVKQIRIFDQNEEGLFLAESKFGNNKKVRFLVGNIRDKNRVKWAMQGVDFVFHTAALKHVAINEYNPFEAIKTNVSGTENVVMAAIEQNVRKVINISTDKASLPFSTMGASKLLAERITAAANHYKGSSRTICSSVRFGNVLASSGSVIPIFIRQIREGGPVTITDERMIRYFMTIPQAVDLILEATSIAQGGEVFILKMPSIKIVDLANVLIKEYSLKHGIEHKKIKIKTIGIRPGEKIQEELINSSEYNLTLEMKKMFLIPPIVETLNLSKKEVDEKLAYYKRMGAKKVNWENNKIILLKKDEIKKMLKKINVI